MKIRPNRNKGVQLEMGLSDLSVVPQKGKTPLIIVGISPLAATEVFDTYWKFAAERQEIFFKKLKGNPPPWTSDPILTKYKFTNAYRASDRVSQYLIRNVIYSGNQTPIELFFRIILFRIFNRIETWQLLEKEFGEITYRNYSYKHYDQVLTKALKNRIRIFSAAYMMPSGNKSFGHPRKHQNFLILLDKMIKDDIPVRIQELRSMKKSFEYLRSYPLIGDFLAYQYVTDINYSILTNYSEMEFVIPGPGAKNGIRKCFYDLQGLNESDVIRLVADRQTQEFERLGINFKSLYGRPLQLIDCQNLFCEIDKYARAAYPEIKGIDNRTHIKQIYRPIIKPINYWYPPKWGINNKLMKEN